MKAICANCDALNSTEARYCRACGREFADSIAAGAPLPSESTTASDATTPVGGVASLAVDEPGTDEGPPSGPPDGPPSGPPDGPLVATPYDQEHTRPRRPTGPLIGIGVAVMAALGVGVALVSGQGGNDDNVDNASSITVGSPPTEPAPTTPETSAVASTLPATTVPPTTVAPTTVPPTTVAPTTVPPTTVPPTTAPPTTAPPPTAPPTTAPPSIWETPTLPTPPLATSGPGTPLIEAAQLPSGVFAADALPFFLNAQRLVDAYAASDWTLVRALDPTTTATDEELAFRFGALDRASLILLDAGVAGGSYEMVVGEVLYNGGTNQTAVRCIQYVSNGTTGTVLRRGGFDITTIDGNVSPESVRLNDATFAEVQNRCTFAALAATFGL